MKPETLVILATVVKAHDSKTIIQLVELSGLSEPSVRQGLHRLKERGRVFSENRKDKDGHLIIFWHSSEDSYQAQQRFYYGYMDRRFPKVWCVPHKRSRF